MSSDTHSLSVGLMVLAAGASTRLGQSKQLLKFGEETLIRMVCKVALRSVCFPIQVVLGANAFTIVKEIENLPVYIDINKNWELGMGSSISYGMKCMLKIIPKLEAVVILVCDQPYVSSQLINDLVFKFSQTNYEIIGSCYKNKNRVPAVFAASQFERLLSLEKDEGARNIIDNCDVDLISSVPFDKGEFDIDTYEDYFMALQELGYGHP